MSAQPELSCVKLPEWALLSSVVKDRGNDWWVSSFAGVHVEDIPRKMVTERIEGELVSDIFTHCYYQRSMNIKETSDSLIDIYGLGLRRKKVQSKEVPGAIFVLVNKTGPTILQQRRGALADDSRKLSTEERLRRTHMTTDVVAIEHIIAEAKRRKFHFWLTSWSLTSAEEGKKKAVAATFAGLPDCTEGKQLVTEVFEYCLLADVTDCQKACVRITALCGPGYRKTAVRAKETPGCVALFFTGECMPRLSLPGAKLEPAAAPRSDSPTVESSQKRRRTEAPEAGSSKPMLPIESGKACSHNIESVKSEAAKGSDSKAVVAADEERRFIQVRLLEKRLAVMLPTMARATLSTTMVQSALEKQMQKPSGFLDAFKMDLARIWRSFKEAGRA